MSVLTAVCSPLPAARLLRGSVRCVGLFLFPHGGAASAQASPCREAAAAAAAVTTTKPRAPDGPPPCRRRLPPLSLPSASLLAGHRRGLRPLEAVMARSSREPQSRFPPLYITTHGAGLLSSQFLRSAKLGTGEGRARLSRVRAANGGGTEEVPAWASLEVPRAPACSSPAGSAGEWPPDPGSGLESFRLFLVLLPLECAVGNSADP